ncbi:MAG: hypothetical protein EAZ95_05190 [Bacteroidetes bacterium]|nr:MAG: hypothetical protein EAZ95_05190 [Bacteroidota bacterium]
MTTQFNAKTGLIEIEAKAKGNKGFIALTMVLDTGANSTVINADLIETLGYNLSNNPHKTTVTTGNGNIEADRIQLESLEALGYTKENALIVCYPFPPELKYDGVIGLTFLRQHNICLHFKEGVITFE